VLGLTILGSGSGGNSLVVHGPDSLLMLDVGFSLRETRRRMRATDVPDTDLTAILVSHEHSDHVKGLRAVANHFQAPVYCNRGTGEMVKARGMSPERLHLFSAGTAFDIGEITVQPFSIPHDAMDPMGFIFRHGDQRIGIVTDLGHVGHTVCHNLQACDILVVESNHEIALVHQSSRPWSLKQRVIGRHGHLSNADSMTLLKRVVHDRTRYVVLAHASDECNRYDLVEKHVSACLSDMERQDIQPLVARQKDPLPTIWVE